MRVGSNIRKRADGRYEARYIKDRDENGKIIYGYCYGKSYEEAERKRSSIISENGKASRSPKEMNLLILGAGDHGREVEELAKNYKIFANISFLDDGLGKANVEGPCSNFYQYFEKYGIAIPAVGDGTVRMKWFNELVDAGFIIPKFIHPAASVSPNAEIGAGTVIYAGATVGIGATIGKGCIIGSGAIIDRHATVPDWTWVKCGTVVRSETE